MRYHLKHMKEFSKGTMQGRLLCEKNCMLDCGGFHCSKMLRTIVIVVIIANVLAKH